MKFETEQEVFWAGEFGNDYIDRIQNESKVVCNTALFLNIIKRTQGVSSVIEFGANVGLNLRAIKQILPNAVLSAIEINSKAIGKLEEIIDTDNIYPTSILSFESDIPRDFVLTKGVLIHINPKKLQYVYRLLYQTSRRYICLVEYYNPTPVEVSYRGHKGKLFKRDFAGELMDKYKDLRLVDYGFIYHRDCNFPQDDMTWFLLEK